MLTTIKPHVERALKPVALLFKNVHPNIISLTGLIFPVIFFICVVQGWYWWALFVFIFNAVDLLDGMVARAQNKVSAFGGFLDSTIDRVSDFTVIAAFGFANLVPWSIIMPLIMFTYLISYIRSRTELAAKGKLVAAVGLIERTERLITVFVSLLLFTLFPLITVWGLNLAGLTMLILLILSVFTVGQRVEFAYRKL